MATLAMLKLMRSVNIADLKNHLSRYLNEVRRGEELSIRGRNVLTAKIVPLDTDKHEDEELALAAAGLLKLPEGRLRADFWSTPAPRVSQRRSGGDPGGA